MTSDQAGDSALRAGGLTRRRAERQVDAQQQAVGPAVLRLNHAAESLDVAPGDPQPDAEMRALVVVLLIGRAVRIIAIEDPGQILGRDARPRIADHQLREAAARLEANADALAIG